MFSPKIQDIILSGEHLRILLNLFPMALPTPCPSPTIAPSILSADFGNLSAEIQSITKAGADWIHVDVMDGTFVPPITFGDNVVSIAKKATSIPLDVHLMIVDPEKHLESFAKAGANVITVHQEVCPHLHKTLGGIRALGCAAGVSINPATAVESIFDVLSEADLVLVMTVNPGFGGQKFIAECLTKISKLSAEIKRRGLNTRIEVDGGINPSTAKQCRDAGASIFVAGSAVFGAADRGEMIKQLRG